MQASEKKLRYVLIANALFSLLSGTSLAIFHKSLGALMGIANGQVLIGIGIGLILFSATVFHASKRKELSANQVKSIILQDWAWVIGSLAIILLQAWRLSTTAYWLIGIVAVLVADFAVFQRYFLRKLT